MEDKQITEELLQHSKPKLRTNRKKAVIFANLYMIFHFCYFCTAKLAMSPAYGVNGIDLCLVRTCIVSVFNYAEIRHNKVPIQVP